MKTTGEPRDLRGIREPTKVEEVIAGESGRGIYRGEPRALTRNGLRFLVCLPRVGDGGIGRKLD